jgi:hydroxymethylpyrimidine/phosphomethylpyrimidine kinase
MRAFGVHACVVATALTAQNTRAVSRIEPVSIEMLRAQIEVLLEDVDVRASQDRAAAKC